MSGYEPNPGAQADIEADEIRRSRQLRRLEQAESAARFVPAELAALQRHVLRQGEQLRALETRLRQIELGLEAATALADHLGKQLDSARRAEWDRQEDAGEIETVCCICHAHLRGPVGAPRVSHGLCDKCLEEKFPEKVME